MSGIGLLDHRATRGTDGELSAQGVGVDTPPSMSERERILRQTADVRDRAEDLLRGLIEARARTRLTRSGDAMREVRGESAMDRAIDSTRRMVETLRKAFEDATRELSEADARLLRGDD